MRCGVAAKVCAARAKVNRLSRKSRLRRSRFCLSCAQARRQGAARSAESARTCLSDFR
ncbi:hypothetical protein Ga0080574_TMP3458 [Salipiger abyssi]|uniref:Uncharacterized protein n=1 Tax=Salipiger abyssi TaxID=1250539 RepID=A0A1P8UWM7_9RHOB|nr:hypothetical protein Ga0080574_TMP3458 [Salipiger abyssi]